MGALPARVDYMPMSHHTSILQDVTGERCTEFIQFYCLVLM